MRPSCDHAGFTLIEMIIVIAITAIVGSMVAVFLRAPLESYVAQARRARLADAADTALRRMALDIRLALPHSVRVDENSPESLLLGKQITLIPDLVRAANPESYVHADLPPFLIQHGTHDTIVPHQQSVNMAAKLTSALGSEKVTLALLPGAGHGDAQFETDENIRSVIGFLDKHLS